MNDLEMIQERLSDTPISKLPALAEECGVPFGTLFKIKYGKTLNPRYETVSALVKFFRAHPLPEHRV